jgi:hypothetical protein
MVSRHVFFTVSVLGLILFLFFIPSANAQYGYMGGPPVRMYSVNGFGGSYPYYGRMMNRGYYPQVPYYPTTRPYTLHLDQYHHVEYNKPGRVGWPEVPKYYNANVGAKSRQWGERVR